MFHRLSNHQDLLYDSEALEIQQLHRDVQCWPGLICSGRNLQVVKYLVFWRLVIGKQFCPVFGQPANRAD